jgi:hypothetical protein
MSTEVWFRNPSNYIRELVEAGSGNVAWDRGMLVKRRIDPYRHAEAYFGPKRDWRLLLIGDQGAAELQVDHNIDSPVAVYPVWNAIEDSISLLEEMMESPLGEDAGACNDPTVQPDERPVYGQEHRVVVANLPSLTAGPGRALIRKIKELQEDYPDCILHIHGLYAWRIQFGFGFGSIDIDPRTNAGKGKVYLPTGKEVLAERTVNMTQWISLMGMKPIDLMREPRMRCIYNIRAAVWAGEHYMENIAFKSMGSPVKVDPDAVTHVPATTASGSHLSKPQQPSQPTDKIQCDMCTLANSCKYYRTGSVCSVPGSEPASLAKHFGTRDADHIIDGLSQLQALSARRLEKGVAEEDVMGDLNPEVSKIINQMFTQGEKLAKLVDPTRFKGPSVQVNVGSGNTAALTASTPNQILGSVVRELESRGVSREKITPEMIGNLLAEMGGAGAAPKAIEGTVISRNDG